MLFSKLRSIVLRMCFPFVFFPLRLLRLVFHILYPIFFKLDLAQYKIIKNLIDWLAMFPFYMIDLFGISDLYEIVNELINWKIRDINSHEKFMIKEVFTPDIPINTLRVNPNNQIAKKLRIAYVSFRQVNFNATISNDVFIHEVVHIWQYQLFGAVYIYFAWKAQISKEGYDYGKVPALIKGIQEGKLFHEFNFEQQAEIIQDYFRNTNFSNSNQIQSKELLAYTKYLNEMNNLT